MRFEQRGPGRFVLIPETESDETLIDHWCDIIWDTEQPILTTYMESSLGSALEFDLYGGDGDDIHATATRARRKRKWEHDKQVEKDGETI